MSKKPINPYSTPTPWDDVSAGYERTTKNSLALFATEAIRRAKLKRTDRVLDVACGPGTLSLLINQKVAHIDALDFSQDMLKLFRREVRKNKIKNIAVQFGDGQNLPYEKEQFDAAFSMFGLMFFPDRPKGFSELYRALKSGGFVAVTSWASLKKSPVMKLMFSAISQMTPMNPPPVKAIRTLEDPEVFREEMVEAGFRDVRVIPLVKKFPFKSASHFWNAMVEGSAPIVMMKKEMGARMWKEKEELALAYVQKHFPKVRTSLTSQAWLGTGRK